MENRKKKEYLDFMYNPENIRKCDGCPANEGLYDWQDRLPCGQWNCWVAVHCARDGKEA